MGESPFNHWNDAATRGYRAKEGLKTCSSKRRIGFYGGYVSLSSNLKEKSLCQNYYVSRNQCSKILRSKITIGFWICPFSNLLFFNIVNMFLRNLKFVPIRWNCSLMPVFTLFIKLILSHTHTHTYKYLRERQYQ